MTGAATPGTAPAGGAATTDPPLYVDLDGTLTPTDTLHESVLQLLKRNPLYLVPMLLWLWRGRAAFKRELAARARPDPATLPLNPALLDYLRQERARGRTLVLATAAEVHVARAVAARVGLFDDVLATSTENLRGDRKLRAIRDHARGPFAYAGNDEPDLAIWRASVQAIAVAPAPGLRRRLLAAQPGAMVIEAPAGAGWPLLRALRPAQWSKNLLLFLPLLAGHVADPARWEAAALTFLAFGLVASATYLVNDLFDLEADRSHPRKCRRPLASGQLQPARALLAAAVTGAAGLALALAVSPTVAGMLLGYLAITALYTARLKSMVVVDVLALAVLYAWRVLTGAVAGGVVLSNWLLAFALFQFLSLALVKRCSELERIVQGTTTHAPGRGYLAADLPALRTMGVASGFLAVMVLTLYIDSQNGKAMYPSYVWLWGLAPLLMGWTMRIWLLVSRGQLHREDPVAFVLTDRASWLTLAAMAGCALAALRGPGSP